MESTVFLCLFCIVGSLISIFLATSIATSGRYDAGTFFLVLGVLLFQCAEVAKRLLREEVEEAKEGKEKSP